MGCRGCGGNRVKVTVPAKTAPLLDPDGSIHFPEAAPNVEGYHVLPSDNKVLVPNDPVPCVWRITGIILQKNGAYAPYHVCRNSKCKHQSKPVNLSDCKDCEWREEK